MPTQYLLYERGTDGKLNEAAVTIGDALQIAIELLMRVDLDELDWAMLVNWRSVLKREDKKATEALERLSAIEAETVAQGMTTEQVQHLLAARDVIAAQAVPEGEQSPHPSLLSFSRPACPTDRSGEPDVIAFPGAAGVVMDWQLVPDDDEDEPDEPTVTLDEPVRPPTAEEVEAATVWFAADYSVRK